MLLLYRDDESCWESQRSHGESGSTSNQPGCWDVPGGKVEEDESPTQAAVRETGEEIGVDAELEKPFFSGEFQHSGEIFLWHGYIASISGEPEIQEDRLSEMRWVDPDELDDMDLAPNLVQILPALRRIS